MALNYHVYEAKRALMATAVGTAVSRWANLEGVVFTLCVWGLGHDEQSTAKLLSSFKSFSLTLDFTSTAVLTRLQGAKAETYWRSLIEYVREHSGDRNFIAHTPIVSHCKGHPDEADWAESEPMIGPALSSVLLNSEKQPPLSMAEVWELVLDFQHAVEAASEFLTAVQQPHALPDKFSSPVVRRRPPRKVRLATSHKSQQPRRAPSRPKRAPRQQ